MKIITFRLFDRTYLGHKLFDDKFSSLMELLSSDVGPYGDFFTEFIEDVDHHITIRNYSCVIKDENDILISCQFDEDPYENCIRMPRKEFLSILSQWHELVKQDPQEIIVFKEGDSYRLEGHEFPNKQ